MLSRRRFLQLSAALPALGLYTWQVEPHWLEIVERPLPLRGLPECLQGARLAQLSDLHIGPKVDDQYLLHTFERVQALQPDLVVYTGDFISFEGDHLAHLRRIFGRAPRGRLASLGILGNHDYGRGWARAESAKGIVEIARSAGVRILRNEAADVEGLQIAGLDEFWAGQFHPERVLPRLDPKRASLVLSHNPDTVDQPRWGQYQGWILCGHTHGGQCKPPFLPPPMLSVRNRRYVAGEYALSGGRRLYINRGVGHLMQVRFNARPEVTLFTLVNDPAPPGPRPHPTPAELTAARG